MPRRKGGVLLPTIVILAGIVIAFVIFTGFYTEFLWFDSVDKAQVFNISLFTRAIMFAVMALIMAIVSSLALWISFRTRPYFVGSTPEQASLERYRIAIEPYRQMDRSRNCRGAVILCRIGRLRGVRNIFIVAQFDTIW